MGDYSGYSGSTLAVNNMESENGAANAKPLHSFDPTYPYNQGFGVAAQDNSPDTNTPESLSETAMDYHSSMGYMGMMPHYNYNIPRGGEQTYQPMETNFDNMYHQSYMPFISSPQQQSSLTQMMHTEAPFQMPHSTPFMRMDSQEDPGEIRGRAENWHYAETKQFVQILLAHRQELSDLRRHPGVWETVAGELQTCGYDRSVDKCKNRWKVLVAKYKKYTEKTLKNKSPRHQTPLPHIKLPNFMSNMDCHPGLSINYQYYHSHRLANPHGGTGGFEFYTEMHQLLSHIYSHGPDGIIKRRTPQLSHQPQDSSLIDPNRSFHPFRNENSP